MGFDDFSYADAGSDTIQASVDIVHDNAAERGRLGDALRRADYRVGESIQLEELLSGDGFDASGDVLLLDCEHIGGAGMARLAQLDLKLARLPVQVLVTCALDQLDAVFASLDQTDPQILIDPTRAEILVAVARAANASKTSKLREMSDDERLSLMRLSQQVDALAQRLEDDGMAASGGLKGTASVTNIKDGAGLAGADKPALPDPRHVRQVIRQRQARMRFFDGALFGDPAWDMLLDLTASRAEHQAVSVTSLCIASGVPATTALRWVKQMVDVGLFERTEDESDKRRAFIALSDKAADAMAQYFAEFRAQELAA